MKLGRTFVIAYLLNFVWENSQMPLYAGYEGFWAHVPMHLLASLVDAVVTVVLLAIVNKMKGGTPFKLCVLGIGGGVTALFFELAAQGLGMWSYSSNMPMIGGVGLLPLMQLTILVPLASLMDIKERKAV